MRTNLKNIMKGLKLRVKKLQPLNSQSLKNMFFSFGKCGLCYTTYDHTPKASPLFYSLRRLAGLISTVIMTTLLMTVSLLWKCFNQLKVHISSTLEKNLKQMKMVMIQTDFYHLHQRRNKVLICQY